MVVNVQLQKPESGFEQHLRPGLCIGVCARITDAPAGNYGPNMDWWWEPYYTVDGEKAPVPGAFNDDGTVYQLRDRTSTKFGKGKTPDKTAKARVRVEALLKREIDDDEPLEGILDQCLRKPVLLFLALSESGYLNVELVKPYKAGTQVPMPPPAAVVEEDLPFDDGSSVAVADDEAPPF